MAPVPRRIKDSVKSDLLANATLDEVVRKHSIELNAAKGIWSALKSAGSVPKAASPGQLVPDKPGAWDAPRPVAEPFQPLQIYAPPPAAHIAASLVQGGMSPEKAKEFVQALAPEDILKLNMLDTLGAARPRAGRFDPALPTARAFHSLVLSPVTFERFQEWCRRNIQWGVSEDEAVMRLLERADRKRGRPPKK
jgi:hypothetical protein